MLADETTGALRGIRTEAVAEASWAGSPVSRGWNGAMSAGRVDTCGVEGIDPDSLPIANGPISVWASSSVTTTAPYRHEGRNINLKRGVS